MVLSMLVRERARKILQRDFDINKQKVRSGLGIFTYPACANASLHPCKYSFVSSELQIEKLEPFKSEYLGGDSWLSGRLVLHSAMLSGFLEGVESSGTTSSVSSLTAFNRVLGNLRETARDGSTLRELALRPRLLRRGIASDSVVPESKTICWKLSPSITDSRRNGCCCVGGGRVGDSMV
jgi:hypothetical protein